MAIDKWHELDIELSAWLQIGKRPTMWWRDDDAVKFTPALRKLVCLTQEMNIPLALAVIPSGVQESLAKFIDGISEIDVLQHGLSHMNHAPIGEKKAEFGPHRSISDMLADVAMGKEALGAFFGNNLVPVFVPPWNRIDDRLLRFVKHANILGISRFNSRKNVYPVEDLLEINCQVDPVNWGSGKRNLYADHIVIDQVITNLRIRRTRTHDIAEPIGLLTHHLVMYSEGWTFLKQLLARLCKPDGVKWVMARDIFVV